MMGPLAAIAIGAAVLGISFAQPPEPTPLTEVQREMVESGMFESDSFREPAFEALVENVRSWSDDASHWDSTPLNIGMLEQFDSLASEEPGRYIRAWGEVMMVDSLGDAFPGVNRLTLRTGDRATQMVVLVFAVDEPTPAIGDNVGVFGRAYKVMELPTQQNDGTTSFPAVVGRIDSTRPTAPFSTPAAQSTTGVAIITALTGALAVVLFIVVMGRHMLGRPAPRRSPLASTPDRPDDPSDA